MMKRVSNMEMNGSQLICRQNKKATNSTYNWFAYQYQRLDGVQVLPKF
jgi:hypothetical protein